MTSVSARAEKLAFGACGSLVLLRILDFLCALCDLGGKKLLTAEDAKNADNTKNVQKAWKSCQSVGLTVAHQSR